MNSSGLTILNGDLFSAQAPAIGHGVNLAGVMGAGIAVQMKRRFPAMFSAYAKACAHGSLKTGDVLPWRAGGGRWVYNLVTQDKPGPHASLEWVEESVHRALDHADQNHVPVLALPMIGCGIGGVEVGGCRSSAQSSSASPCSRTRSLDP